MHGRSRRRLAKSTREDSRRRVGAGCVCCVGVSRRRAERSLPASRPVPLRLNTELHMARSTRLRSYISHIFGKLQRVRAVHLLDEGILVGVVEQPGRLARLKDGRD